MTETPTIYETNIEAVEAAKLGSEMAKQCDLAIKRALDHYFQFDGGDPKQWDEDAIAELGQLVHISDGSVEFWMGDCKLVTFGKLEISVEIIYGAPLTMFNHSVTEHWAE